MQKFCYNSVMNWVRRQLMRPSRPRGKMKTASASSASLRDENSSRTSRTLREIKTTTYIWDDWNIIREIQWPVASDQWPVGTLATSHYPLVTDYIWGLDLDGTLQGAGGVGGLLAVVRSNSNSDSNSSLYFPHLRCQRSK